MVKKVSQKYEEKIIELEEKYKRVLADYQNQERRHKEGQSQLIKMANATLIEKLLINIDSLELAQKHLQDKGLQIVIDQFLSSLSQ
jgi:molecular chaperone GrpE (heat shock protein)